MNSIGIKGGKVKFKELPPPVAQVIKRYINLSGRTLNEAGPVFTATVDNGDVLKKYYGKEKGEKQQPLSGEAAQQALIKHANKAGVRNITLQSLRHLGAELYHIAAGKDVQATQRFLDHKNISTTQIYLNQLEGSDHKHWQKMMNDIGIEY